MSNLKICRNLLILCLLLVFQVQPLSAFARAGASFPGAEWPISTPEEQGIRASKLVEMMEVIKKKRHHIDSISIVRNGHLVLDAYVWPFGQDQRHRIFSCTKSIMSALIGIAIHKGYLKGVDQPLTDLFPDKTLANMDERKKAITLKHLLMMASGFQCRDSYLYDWVGLREMIACPDWAQYVLDLPMAGPPGSQFEYCNGVSHLFSVIIQDWTKMQTLDFAREHLFNPLDIKDIIWTRSPKGYEVGYGRMWLKPHDMARFGWLYLNRGRWDDRQIVPSAWVEESTRARIKGTLLDHYGYQWWVSSKGYCAAVGYRGQCIIVHPGKNMVTVFTADLPGEEARIVQELYETYIVPAAESAVSLPLDPTAQSRLGSLLTGLSQEPPKGHIWISEREGAAKDGLFERRAAPAFKFEYPVRSRPSALDFPGQIMRMKALGDIDFSVSVVDIPAGVELKDFVPRVYGGEIEKVGREIKVILNEEIQLSCGTRAYRAELTWVVGRGRKVRSEVVAAYKGGKCVFVNAHSRHPNYVFEAMVKSLVFK